MREYWILAKLQLSSLFGVNKLLHTRTPEERKQGRKGLLMLVVLTLSFGSLSVTYSVMLADALREAGQLPALLGLMALAASLLVLFFSIFETKGVLFGFGDYDTVMSWPVSVSAVAASRVTAMYVYNLAYVLLLLLPAGVVYGVYASAPVWFYPLYLLLMLLIPALPTILGAAVGTLVTLLTAGMKRRGTFGAVFQTAFAFLIMLGSMRLNSGLTALADSVPMLTSATRGYPPAQWFAAAATGGEGGLSGFLLLAASCALSIWLFVKLLGLGFVRLNSRLSAVPHARAYRMERLRRSGQVRALYRVEWRRYVGSSLYLSNTAFGWVLLIVAAVIVGVVRPPVVMEMLGAPELAAVRKALPLLLGWLAVMASPAASAVSMEGNRLWIVKSMPIPARDWLVAKLLVSLTPAVPALLVSTVLFALGLQASFAECLALFFVPLSYALFAGVTGLWLNLKLPKLDWKAEAEVVKQSMAVMIQIFAAMFVIGAPAAILIVTGAGWLLPASAAAVCLIAALVFLRLTQTADKRLYRL